MFSVLATVFVRKGAMPGSSGRKIERAKDPATFWFVVIAYFAAAAFFVALALFRTYISD